MPPSGAGHTLRLERVIAAAPERVYAAWTQPETLSRWFAPTDQYVVTVHALEPRVGGRFRFEMRHTGGNVHLVSGVYDAVEPNVRLSFSWHWETQVASESHVTVHFDRVPGGTRLVLIQEQFVSTEIRDRHEQGWGGSLPRLAALFE